MIGLPRTLRRGFPIFALTLAVGTLPVLPSDLAETPLSPRERKALDEYRLDCRPGRFIEDVRECLDRMQQAHPGSIFQRDTAFMAEVHYLDRGFLWNGNGKRPPGWVYSEMFDSIFNGYAPSREAWNRSRIDGDKATGFAALGMLFAVTDVFFGLHALVNEPPRGQRSLKVYRFAEIALPAAWIFSFVYSGIYKAREDREFDEAFFEANGRVIAKRLARDP